MKTAIAYCFRSGVLKVGASAPLGAIALAAGPAGQVEKVTSACARHAYDGRTLLVPGIPEAEHDSAALRAAIAFQKELLRRGLRRPAAPPRRRGGAA